MGTKDLPDIYMPTPSSLRLEDMGIYIRQIPSAHVITNIINYIYHFWHSKNPPKPERNCSASLFT